VVWKGTSPVLWVQSGHHETRPQAPVSGRDSRRPPLGAACCFWGFHLHSRRDQRKSAMLRMGSGGRHVMYESASCQAAGGPPMFFRSPFHHYRGCPMYAASLAAWVGLVYTPRRVPGAPGSAFGTWESNISACCLIAPPVFTFSPRQTPIAPAIRRAAEFGPLGVL